ncbi:MAG: DUF6473 family protein [Paracoccaceae bacterium]
MGTSKKSTPYELCRYQGTKLSFRGPQKSFRGPYIATLGGTETFGPFVQAPYPTLLEDWLDQTVVNLGVRQAGVSLFASEQWLLDCASKSDVAVLQVLGAGNMSNRLYSVHSRRNDRFLAVSPALKELFPEVDFTEFSFIRHLLQSLADRSSDGFEVLVEELRFAWVQRMKRVLSCIDAPVIMLWMSDRSSSTPAERPQGPEPLFVTKAMMGALEPLVASVVEVVASTEVDRLEGKQYTQMERDAAYSAPTPVHHAQVAEQLCNAIREIQMSRDVNCDASAIGRDRDEFMRSRTAI